VLDDTTIREFLRDDYPPIVDAVALVIGDVRGAQDAVRDALLLAWVQSEAGEPIDELAGWVTGLALQLPRKGLRRLGADRRARARLARGGTTGDGGDVRRALAGLTWRQREVAVLRYVLSKTSRETADALGRRNGSVERSLTQARAALSATLLPAEERGSEEALTERFESAIRHAEADPQLFERLVTSMTRRETTTKRAKTVVAAAVAVAIGAGAVALAHRSPTDRAAPTPTATLEPGLPADAASIPGVPFPACHVSVTHSFSGGWFGVVYLFGRGLPSVSCFKLGPSPVYLALDRGGAGLPKDTVVFGPIECDLGCRAFATGDVDGDGWAELAVVALDAPRADTIDLYRVHPDAVPPFRQITMVAGGERVPFSFQWGGTGAFRSGAICATASDSRTSSIDAWTATRHGGVWQVEERFYAFHGVTATRVGSRRSSTTSTNRLPGGLSLQFCGMPVGF
jgi:DNA-directed RNA polymerase specialized sigma24 family protein